MQNIMLVGIQWSGKWTQARKILEKYPNDYILFEMWGELRKLIQSGTPDGDHAKSFMDQGLKVPTEYVVRLSKKFIEENKEKRILIDGAIRSKEQNDAMEAVWGNFDVIYLELDKETAVKRLCGRRIDPETQETFPASFTGDTNPKTWNKLVTRDDDKEEAIRKRISWSISDTLPLLALWETNGHKIYTINANQGEDDIFHDVETKVLKK